MIWEHKISFSKAINCTNPHAPARLPFKLVMWLSRTIVTERMGNEIDSEVRSKIQLRWGWKKKDGLIINLPSRRTRLSPQAIEDK